MFYTEIFKSIPLKCGERWEGFVEKLTAKVLYEWIDYIIEEEGKFVCYLMSLESTMRQNYLDSVVNRLVEAYKQSTLAYEETEYSGFLIPVFSCRTALGLLVFRFRELKLSCSKEVIDKWANDCNFINELRNGMFGLPVELDTPRARKYIGKAIEKGFIASTGSSLKRTQSKAKLAYFLEKVFCKDDKGKDNGQKFPESALNKLCNEDRLGKARSQLANNKKKLCYDDIDSIFNQ